MTSYYAATANPHTAFPPLEGEATADICVIGAGYTGLLTAIELAENGYSVTLVEAHRVGWGASGRNGGQIATGYQPGMIETAKIVGHEDAKKLWQLSSKAVELLQERISRHGIACDLKAGELYTAAKARHRDWLLREQEFCEGNYAFTGYEWIDAAELQERVATTRYHGALLDHTGGHLHPLNYALGLAKAARSSGVTIYEKTLVQSIERGKKVTIRCAQGNVTAANVVLAGNAYLEGLETNLEAHFIPVTTYIMATEPLGQERAQALFRTEACVSDTNYNLDYFRMSADHRLLYGGRDYAGQSTGDQRKLLRQHMLKTFPQMSDVGIDYIWDGKVAVTRNRLPDIGRLDSNIYYAHGFSGQGVPLSAIAGKMTAEAIMGETGNLDVFGRIPHKPFPGGTAMRVPLLSLAMFYYRLRDLL